MSEAVCLTSLARLDRGPQEWYTRSKSAAPKLLILRISRRRRPNPSLSAIGPLKDWFSKLDRLLLPRRSGGDARHLASGPAASAAMTVPRLTERIRHLFELGPRVVTRSSRHHPPGIQKRGQRVQAEIELLQGWRGQRQPDRLRCVAGRHRERARRGERDVAPCCCRNETLRAPMRRQRQPQMAAVPVGLDLETREPLPGLRMPPAMSSAMASANFR